MDRFSLARPEEGGLSDDVLLQAIALGDQAAFRRLMEKYARPTLAMAQRITGNSQDADEVVQEAFLKVWKLAPDWRPERGAMFSTWLYRVVLNASVDRRRLRPFAALEDAGTIVDQAPGGFDVAREAQSREIVAEAMSDLRPRQRDALLLFYFGDLSRLETARILGLSIPALEGLLTRGKKALRVALRRRGVTGIGDVT